MTNVLSPELLAQIFSQQADDCFLTLLTISHPDILVPFRFVNNTENIISNGLTYSAFPFKITLPPDNGEDAKEAAIVLDNVSLELIQILRQITTPLDIDLKMVLGSIPDDIQMELAELKMGNIQYNSQAITGKMYQDNFMYSAMTSETYTPKNFPGLF